MKLFYETRNLALTALVGAALALGTPAVLAQTVDENAATEQQESASYDSDKDLIEKLQSLLEAKIVEFMQEDPALYEQMLAPQCNQIMELLNKMMDEVANAHKDAVNTGEAYVSPLPSDFEEEIMDMMENIPDKLVEVQIAYASEQVNALGTALIQKVADLKALFDEKLLEEVGDEEESFYLNEEGSDKILAELEAMYVKIAEAAEESENFESPVTEAWVEEMTKQIDEFYDDAENIINKAHANIQLNTEDIETIMAAETGLVNAFNAIVENINTKLGEDFITDENEAFFVGEETYNEIAAQIDALRILAVEAYEVAAADHWQTYESKVMEGITAIDEAVVEYQDSTENLANKAQANIQLNDEDVDMIIELENSLQETFTALATEVEDNIDEDILEGIREYLIEDGYVVVAEKIDSLRLAMVEAYDAAEADNWQSYEPQVVPNATSVDEAIAVYQQTSSARIKFALESIDAHQYDVDIITSLDEMLGGALADLMEEKPELFEEGSEFIEQYEEIEAKMDELWKQIRQAADQAEADNWQSYNAVFEDDEDAQALFDQIEEFIVMAGGDTAKINLYKWDKDNNAILALDSELMDAVDNILNEYPDFDIDPDFDAIQAAIEALRHKMAAAYEAAEEVEWQSYQCPYTEEEIEAIQEMIETMVAHAQGSTSIEGVNAEVEKPMIYSIGGKRLDAPVKGQINIFIYSNRVEKKIVK